MLLSFYSSGQQVVNICQDERTTFTYYCQGANSWFLDGDLISSDSSVTINWDSTGNYTLIASNECFNTQYTITVLGCYVLFPSSFSPNGDGLNDFWKPEGEGIEDIRWYIFDRWGLQLYAANGKDDSWDGCMWYQGTRRPCQADVYVWLAEWYYKTGGLNSKNGRVTIVR